MNNRFLFLGKIKDVGAHSNKGGFDRNASDNNMTYALFWFMF